MKIKLLSVVFIFAFSVLCFSQDKKVKTTAYLSVNLSPGPNWIKGKTYDEQNLTEHHANMKKLFSQSKLFGYGPVAKTNYSSYLFKNMEQSSLRLILSTDPGVKSGILQVENVKIWNLVFNNSKTPIAGKQLVAATYSPGKAYLLGKKFDDQDQRLFEPHFKYAKSFFEKGDLFLGGYHDQLAGEVVYIFVVNNESQVDSFIQNDPGIKNKLFKAETYVWKTKLMKALE